MTLAYYGGKKRSSYKKHRKSHRGGLSLHEAALYSGAYGSGNELGPLPTWFLALDHKGKIDPAAYIFLNGDSKKTDFEQYLLYNHLKHGTAFHHDDYLPLMLLAKKTKTDPEILAALKKAQPGLTDEQYTAAVEAYKNVQKSFGGRRRRRKSSHKKSKKSHRKSKRSKKYSRKH